MKKALSISIIEDNDSYRDVIRIAVDLDPELRIHSEFSSAEVALATLANPAARPDIILLDINLPLMSGLEALPLLLEHCPESKVLILSQSNAEEDILRAISYGASGYLFKSTGIKDLRLAIKNVDQDLRELDPSVARHLLGLIHKVDARDEVSPISPRELDVLKLLAEGLQKKEIADQLNIAYSTVDTHVRLIFEKLNARNAPSAVSIAYRLGILR
ncbi:MAG: response regulator [Akkermansiaceae bacterium]